jgi:hypothetical protein
MIFLPPYGHPIAPSDFQSRYAGSGQPVALFEICSI